MCPVCRARFRQTRECSRCGADLKIVMGLLARAWRLREASRQAILDGDFPRARALASEAQQISHAPAGRRLESLSSWLAAHGPGTPEYCDKT